MRTVMEKILKKHGDLKVCLFVAIIYVTVMLSLCNGFWKTAILLLVGYLVVMHFVVRFEESKNEKI